ncbi:MAG: serine/threonine-protein kinase, partial [Myxococcota bacterium]|nr:serine/threonine-protein kinase [Myxococcota bacterium]
MPLRPGTAVERYVIEGVLGEGAMAVVYRARHRDLGSLHAIKQLTNRDAEICERLVQEGRLQSTLRHPNVLSVTDLVQIEDLPALVMEYVAGPSLKELLEQATLNLAQVDALVRGLLRGVTAAHGHGLVHRDLKPANILIAITDDALIPKVADFGLAKVLERREMSMLATKTGSSMGTPAYMAPEQIQDASSVDARADVFSLGAILYELVTGARCFQANQLLALWKDICAGEYVPVAERVPDLPQRMVDAIEGALVTDREARICTTAALLETWFGGLSEADAPARFTQTLDVWTEDIRASAAAFVTDASPPTQSRTTTPMGFDQTVAAGGVPEPISGSMSPSEGEQALGPTSSTDTVTTERPSPWPWALVAMVAIIASAWALSRDATPPRSEQPEPTKAATGQVEASTAEDAKAQRVFRLRGVEDAASQRHFARAIDAILQGEIPRAERLLQALVKRHTGEPALHSLLSL